MSTRRYLMPAVGVAAAVALAACGGGDGGDTAVDDGAGTATEGGAGAGAGGGGGTVAVTGTDALAFEPSELSAAAGTVTVELTAEEQVRHTFVIEDLGDQEIVAAGAGETATGTVELEPGSYTFYCSVPGHREAGMEGTLTVE